MNTTRYSASIEYNPRTIKLLSRMLISTFQYRSKIISLLLCIGLIAAGTTIGINSPTGILLIALACLFLPAAIAQEKRLARKQIQNMSGTLHVDYAFDDTSFSCSTQRERNRFAYNSVIRLLKAPGYYYLFPNTQQAYMIDRRSLKPGDEQSFEGFISKKTGLAWTKPVSLMTFNLKQWKFNRDNTRFPL